MLSYTTKLSSANQQDLNDLIDILKTERDMFNDISKLQFPEAKRSIVVLHSKCYYPMREKYPGIPAQIVIRAENEVLSAYRSVKSNKHKLTKPCIKKRLSMRLDKHIYSVRKDGTLSIITTHGRKFFSLQMYPKLQGLLELHQFKDPLIFVRNGELYVSLTFDIKVETQKQRLALGVDLGVRVAAATSDGRIIIDREFNGRKRELRHLKDELKSCGTKSAKRHLRRLRHKERNINKNQLHLIANKVLRTQADTIVLENLKGIKAKRLQKNKYQNQNRISQVPLAELRCIISYKAENRGMTVALVSPAYTSQTDSVTGKVDGKRCGRRFYATNGLVYDSDVNAAVNIGKRSKLPVSQGNLLDGQAVVIRPNVCKAPSGVSQAAML